MDIRKSPETVAAPSGSATMGAFRIRYGRTAIALAGVAGLLTAFFPPFCAVWAGNSRAAVCGSGTMVFAVVLLRFLAGGTAKQEFRLPSALP